MQVTIARYFVRLALGSASGYIARYFAGTCHSIFSPFATFCPLTKWAALNGR